MDRLQFQRSYYPASHMAAVPFAWPSSVGCQYAFSVPMSFPTSSPSGQAYWPQFPGAFVLGEQLKVPGGSNFEKLGSYADDSSLSDDTNQSRKRRRSITSGDSAETCEYDDKPAAAALNPDACSGQSEVRLAANYPLLDQTRTYVYVYDMEIFYILCFPARAPTSVERLLRRKRVI